MHPNDKEILQTGFGLIIILVLVCIAIGLYFIPYLIAWFRGSRFKWVVFALNVCAGWTGILWVVALVLAFWPEESGQSEYVNDNSIDSAADQPSNAKVDGPPPVPVPPSADHVGDLETLFNLKEKGIITEEEFQHKKAQILNIPSSKSSPPPVPEN